MYGDTEHEEIKTLPGITATVLRALSTLNVLNADRFPNSGKAIVRYLKDINIILIYIYIYIHTHNISDGSEM